MNTNKSTPTTSVTVGIQGGKGSFNEEALHTLLKDEKQPYCIKYLYTTKNVLEAVSQKSVDYGLFAIYNTLGGLVDETLEAIGSYAFAYVEQVTIPISHYFMTLPSVPFETIKTVMAHPQVFRQCKNTLHVKYPLLVQKTGDNELIDTAAAAKALYDRSISDTTAILGPRILAEIYDLKIVDSNLQDDVNNKSTFLLVKHL